MSRPLRVVHPGLPHHVGLRGNNRRRLFESAQDRLLFFSALGRASLRARCAVHAAVLMTNHVHLIVTPPDGPSLSTFTKHLAQLYAQRRNRLYDGSGRLFEQRFFSRPLLSEEQVAVATSYIELNPVRAGVVAHPRQDPWSTYRCHAAVPRARFPRSLWTPTAWYLSLGADPKSRARVYAAWTDACLASQAKPADAGPVELKSAIEALRPMRVLRPDGSSAIRVELAKEQEKCR